MDAGLLDFDGADAGEDRPLGQVAVADDLLASGLVPQVGVVVDPVGDLGLDGLGQEAAGPLAEQVGQGVARRGVAPRGRSGW